MLAAGAWLGLSTAGVVAALAIVVVGSAMQGAIGFGLGLLAAPVLAVIDPDFIPVTIIVAVIPLGIGVVAHDHRHIVWNELWFALAGRLPGVVAGTWLVGALGTRGISVVIAVSVLLAVVGSATSLRFRPTHRNLVVAGCASGISGTAAGIGGPPMALTYQHAEAPALRATLAGFFVMGALMSFGALAIGGEVGTRELQLSLLLVPAALVGLALSRLVVRWLPASALRPLILVACSASALALLVETFA